MGYRIFIGDLLKSPKPEEGCFNYIVPDVTSAFAPKFDAVDDRQGGKNSHYSSYGGWSDFCEEARIFDLFFNPSTGLMRNHPGYVELTPEHLIKIREAMEYREAMVGPPPGFGHDGSEDPILARLIWLEYWVRWALRNCCQPVLLNR